MHLKYVRRALPLFAIAVMVTTCKCGGGGGGGGGGTPAPSVLAPCLGAGPITGSISGVFGPFGTAIDQTATLEDVNTLGIRWVNGGTVTADDPVSGRTFTGTLTAVPNTTPQEYSVNFTVNDGGFTITFTGTIIVGPPCTGSGTWSARRGNTQWGQGNWSIP